MTGTKHFYSPRFHGRALGWVEDRNGTLWLWQADLARHNIRTGAVLTFKGKDVVLVRRVGANYGAWRGFRVEER